MSKLRQLFERHVEVVAYMIADKVIVYKEITYCIIGEDKVTLEVSSITKEII